MTRFEYTPTSSGWWIWVVCAGMQSMCMSLFLANSMASIATCDECPSKISSTGLDGGMDRAKNLSHVRNYSVFTHPVSKLLQLNTVPAKAPSFSSSVILCLGYIKNGGRRNPDAETHVRMVWIFPFSARCNRPDIFTSNLSHHFSTFVYNCRTRFIHACYKYS